MSDIATVHKQVKDQWRRNRAQLCQEHYLLQILHTHFVFTCCTSKMLFRRQTVAPTPPLPCALFMNYFWNRYRSGQYHSKVNASLLAQLALSMLCPRHSRNVVIIVISTSSDALLTLELRSRANNDVALSLYPIFLDFTCNRSILTLASFIIVCVQEHNRI